MDDGVAEAKIPPADGLEQPVEDGRGGLGIGKGAVGCGGLNAEPWGERLEPVSAAAKATAPSGVMLSA